MSINNMKKCLTYVLLTISLIAVQYSEATGNYCDNSGKIIITGEYTVDSDNNDFYNTLEIHTKITVKTPGYYFIIGWLYSADGELVTDYNLSQELTAGDNEIILAFRGDYIFRSKKDGPYSLSANVSPGKDYSVICAKNIYKTKPYKFNRFEGGQAQLTYKFSDYGVDKNEDGQFTALAIDVEIDVRRAGEYEVLVWFKDPKDKNTKYSNIAAPNQTFSLNVGTQTVTLKFEPWNMDWARGDGGELIIESIILRDAQSNMNIVEKVGDIYTTQKYTISQFQDGKQPIPKAWQAALKAGDPKRLLSLFKDEQDLYARRDYVNFALRIAVEENYDYSVIVELIKLGADVNFRSSWSGGGGLQRELWKIVNAESIIMVAACADNPNLVIIQLLIDEGADVTAKLHNKKPALDCIKTNPTFTNTNIYNTYKKYWTTD